MRAADGIGRRCPRPHSSDPWSNGPKYACGAASVAVQPTPPMSARTLLLGLAMSVAIPLAGLAQDAIRPFRYTASDTALADLRRRILATKWAEKETVSDQSQGLPL